MYSFSRTVAGLALLSLSAAGCAEEPETRSPEAIADLSVSGFEQFECAVLASFAERKEVQVHFDEGLADFRTFLAVARETDDPKVRRAIQGKTPILVTMALGGPSIDFEIGRIYSEVLQFVDDGLRNRETWTHQKLDPEAPNVEPDVAKKRAEEKYQAEDCQSLAKITLR